MREREEIVRKAREFIDTPYHHQGRVRRVGIDCCGLIIQIAKELDISQFDIDNYPPRGGNKEEFLGYFDRNCIPRENANIGGIAILKMGRYPTHCGIVATKNGERTLIHASNSPAIYRVVEQTIDTSLEEKMVCFYDYPCFKEEILWLS